MSTDRKLSEELSVPPNHPKAQDLIQEIQSRIYAVAFQILNYNATLSIMTPDHEVLEDYLETAHRLLQRAAKSLDDAEFAHTYGLLVLVRQIAEKCNENSVEGLESLKDPDWTSQLQQIREMLLNLLLRQLRFSLLVENMEEYSSPFIEALSSGIYESFYNLDAGIWKNPILDAPVTRRPKTTAG